MANIIKSLIGSAFSRWNQSLNNVQSTFTNTFWAIGSLFSANKVSAADAIKDGYMGNDILYSVIWKISSVTGRMPRKLMTKAAQNNRDKKEVIKGELYDLLMLRPNANQTTDEYIQEIAIHILTTGIGYIHKKSEAVGFIEGLQLIPLPTEAVTPRFSGASDLYSTPIYYDVNSGSTMTRVMPEDMIVVKYINPSLEGKINAEGLSPMQSGWTIIKAANNRNMAESVLFENRGVSGIISTKDGGMSMLPSDKSKLDEGFKQRAGGSHKFNGIMTSSTAVQFTQLGMSANDLKLIESRSNHLRAICNLYGAASELFNDPDNKTYNNRKEASKSFYQDVVIPLHELIVSAHERTIIAYAEKLDGVEYYWEIAKDKIEALNPDPTEIKTQVMAEFKLGLITEDEAREMLGYKALTPEQRTNIREVQTINRPTNGQPNSGATQEN